jgi:hypothetical protein
MKNQYQTFAVCIMLVLFNSPNAGADWIQSNGPSGGDIKTLAVSNGTVFAGTAGGGMYRSTNNGDTWTGLITVNSQYNYVEALAATGNSIFAGTWGGVIRSTDNGTNRTNVDSFTLSYGWVSRGAPSRPGRR